MHRFIDLSRRFRDLTKAELEDPDLLASLNDDHFLSSLDWTVLLRHPRILLLAEAGSGKTAEMAEQAKRLASAGKYAFFIPLESLDPGRLIDQLSPEEERTFAAWRADGHSAAWFFLDSVDELKLNQGNFDRAIHRFAKDVDGLLDRTHVVVSCRPTDWRPTKDMATLQSRLPIPPPRTTTPPTAGDAFMAPLREGGSARAEQESSAKGDGVRTVILLPMGETQIETFARGRGVPDPTAFVAELHRQNAWTFARRPLDCSELLATWMALGRLGTRVEQHEANIAAKLKDDPERPDCGVLPDTQARLGAERLALALALTRTRTVRVPELTLDIDRAQGALDPKDALPDWADGKRQTLLRRPLFDPATYGRVRFHHRSVQEYLAACRLKAMRAQGMTTKALRRLLFSERYGVPVVIPSMRPIAAWLALWNEDVRRELMAREPETLLSLGDPGSLPIDSRAALVKSFVAAYGEGGWRGIHIPNDELRRLACLELAPVIRDLWGSGPTNGDVRDLLLQLIWQGAIKDCGDIAECVANDVDDSDYLRIVGVRALVACECRQALRAIADSILAEPEIWSARIVHGVAGDLFPRTITANELVALVERTAEPKNTVGGFAWTLREIATDVDPSSDEAIHLRNNLANLIWRGRHDKQGWYRLTSQFDYVAPALALLCDRQFSAPTMRFDDRLIRACVIANRFGNNESASGEPVRALLEHFREGSATRELAFWTDLAIMDELTPAKDDWHRLYQTERKSVVGNLAGTDRAWLEVALLNKSDPQRRTVALYALIDLWQQRGRIQAEGDWLCAAVEDHVGLAEAAAKRTAPYEPSAELRRMDRDQVRRQRIREGREQQQLDGWASWRDQLLADPDAAFGPDRLQQTLYTLYDWLVVRDGHHQHFNVWNWDALTQALGADIAMCAANAFKSFWRANPATLWSDRAVADRNNTPWAWSCGLCGLAAEAASPGWAARLTTPEAQTAAVYTTVELNGFTPWLEELAAAHPGEMESVLGAEIIAQLAVSSEYSHLPIVQDLTHAALKVKKILSPYCLAAVATWPNAFADEEAEQRCAYHLGQVLQILDETCVGAERVTVKEQCDGRFVADRQGPLALAWLRGLFCFDPERGAEVLERALTEVEESTRAERSVEALTALFGNHDRLALEIESPLGRALVLGRLIRCAYEYIRPKDDQKHDGVYTPDARDRAEDARNLLLSALLNTPGPEARKVILDLAEESIFAHFPDRLRFMARQRAAVDAEFDAFNAADIQAMETHLEAPPHDRYGLFRMMMDRLDDLSHDMADDDFSDRRTLQTITEESEMQRTLAQRLRDRAIGAYVVTREDEVADRKKPDIRLACVRGNQKAAIEVKIADSWSLKQLETALREQLVEQYLRHETSRAGCLLLTYRGRKKHWKHPETGARLGFCDAVDYLAAIAKTIEHDMAHEVCLAVHALDLTDPTVTAANR